MDGERAMRVVRLAMWSGPRNISTAMMRSWGNREDTVVCDEPLYAHYLLHTGASHPGAEEVMRHHETDWRRVAERLTGDLPPGKSIFYQKHMAHHLLPRIERGWLDRLTHGFLIRDPGEMLASLAKHLPQPRIEDTGLPQQLEIFEAMSRREEKVPPVIDARDVLIDPEGTLRALCRAVDVPFDAGMLEWPAGPRETDGIWARHWYSAVRRSTGFAPYRPKDEPLPVALRELHHACEPYYRRLRAHCLAPLGGSAAAPES
jgi:hypothetical protein